MTFLPLASSSKGNAYIVSDGDTTILLECGLTLKELQKRLGYQVSNINACFVTHEHQDHSKAAAQLIKRGVPVYMSYGTAEAHKDPMDDAFLIAAGDQITVGSLRFTAFETFHNVKESLGFVIDDLRTQERMLFAIDTANLGYNVPRLDYIAIECNYDEDIMAQLEHVDERRKQRVRHSHMEINTALQYLRSLDLQKCKTIWLLHLSATTSNAYRFRTRFEHEFPHIQICVCGE